MTVNAKEKILRAAQKEFAARGFAGARMEAIAKSAGVNKAMLFYYFSSKKALYKKILQHALSRVFGEIGAIISPSLSPSEFFEALPRIYITFFSEHPDLIQIIGIDLIQNPENITSAFSEIVRNTDLDIPKPILWGLIRQWHRQGLISEPAPVQVMMNIIGLSVFSFIGLPMIESISGERFPTGASFYRKRIRSVVNVLKKGMLK